jgi:hypothetical protein
VEAVEAGEPGEPGGPGEAIETPPAITEPVPANVAIPTDRIAVAELISEDGFEYQTVTIELTDDGFSPAVVIMQAGLDTEWIIQNTSSPGANNTLLMPLYGAELDLQSGENPLPLYPTESFEFSNGDNKFYGYVKVVDDLGSIDIEAIQAEAAGFQTMIYPPDTFGAVSGCCG